MVSIFHPRLIVLECMGSDALEMLKTSRSVVVTVYILSSSTANLAIEPPTPYGEEDAAEGRFARPKNTPPAMSLKSQFCELQSSVTVVSTRCHSAITIEWSALKPLP